MPILLDVLKPSVVTKIISRLRTPGNVLSRHFGFQIDGPNVEQFTIPLPQYTYDIFDNTRAIASFRNRGVPAGTFAANPVGNNTVTLARVNEKLPMDYNQIAGIRSMGENAGVIDRVGKRYVEKQGIQAKRRQENAREFMVGSLFRGGLYYLFQSGDDLLPSYASSGALITVDLKFDTQHKLIAGSYADGLAMNTGSNCINGTWATATNDIPLQIQAIDAAFQAEVGEPLAEIYCGYKVWNNVVENNYVRQLAGTASRPWKDWNFPAGSVQAEDGTSVGMKMAELEGLPGVIWHIYDGGVNVYDGSSATSFTKVIPDNYCLFSIKNDQGPGGWMKMVEGTEVIKENDWSPPETVTGFRSWMMEKADPARFELHTLCNACIELNIPKALAIARVQ